jgi:hypothetical protein
VREREREREREKERERKRRGGNIELSQTGYDELIHIVLEFGRQPYLDKVSLDQFNKLIYKVFNNQSLFCCIYFTSYGNEANSIP